MAAFGRACAKTRQSSRSGSRHQMWRDTRLAGFGTDNALSVSGLASPEIVAGFKTISGGHFYVFTQPGPKADIDVLHYAFLQIVGYCQ